MSVITTADGSHTRFSQRYNETFHSTNGAVTEAQHVFLDASGVTERLRAGRPTSVLEIGFGLGLNALMSADVAIEQGTALAFHSFENDFSVLDTALTVNYGPFLRHPAIAVGMKNTLEAVRDELKSSDNGSESGISRASNCPQQSVLKLADNVSVTIHWCNASSLTLTRAHFTESGPKLSDSALPRTALPGTALPGTPQPGTTLPGTAQPGTAHPGSADYGHRLFDAVYLDAFSPDTNPECWSPDFFAAIYPLMALGARMSTYSAKGSVRRAMIASGFTVEKRPGPPGKREMLVATPTISGASHFNNNSAHRTTEC